MLLELYRKAFRFIFISIEPVDCGIYYYNILSLVFHKGHIKYIVLQIHIEEQKKKVKFREKENNKTDFGHLIRFS